jgi:hypothetical protein
MITEEKNKNQWLLLIATMLFYIATVLPHEIVGARIAKVFENVSREIYDRTLLIIVMVAVSIFSILLIRSLIIHRSRLKKGLLYIVLTIIFSAMAIRYLMVVNVESVHFLQYGLISVLVFSLVKRYDYTCWIIFLLAFFDESYQHFFLSPNTFAYLDFNDMFLDQVGAGFGLSSLYCLNRSSGPSNKAIKSGIILCYVALIVLGVILYTTGMMRIWPTEGEPHAFIQIFKKPIEGFWTTVRKVHQFHIFRPLEGLLISLAMILIYSRLDE